jgi:hypothetical protein
LDEARHHRIFDGIELGQEMMELKDETDLPIPKMSKFFFTHLEDVFPLVENLPGGRSIQSPQNMEKGGLSYAGGAHDGCPFPLFKDQVNPF